MKYLAILWISPFVSVPGGINAVVAYNCMFLKECFVGIFSLHPLKLLQ